MANVVYKVYLADMLGCVPTDTKLKINLTLQSFFTKVVQKSSGFSSALVHWIAYYPTPAANELLLYYVPDIARSIVVSAGGQPPAGNDGFSFQGSGGWVSEVYASNHSDAELLARLGFHELMHNKLQLKDPQLHPKGGLAAKTVTNSTALSAGNISDMAQALPNSVPQWAGGVSTLVQGRSDPMSRFYQI
jgi:hypothetical protein